MRRYLAYLIPAFLAVAGIGALSMLGGDKKEKVADKDEKKKEEEKAAPAEGDDKGAIEKLRKFGARIVQDENAKGKPVVSVWIRGGLVTDKDVAPLKGLKSL